MIKNYLFERKKKLQEILDINTKKFEHNEIAINKNEKQISELLNEVDEATNIFSVVAREDSGFKSKEITEIEGKIAVYRDDNLEIGKIIDQTKQEIEKINNCFDELDKEKIEEGKDDSLYKTNDNSVVLEKKEKSLDKDIEKEIVDKLKLCKNLVGVDPRRTAIELDNLIKKFE